MVGRVKRWELAVLAAKRGAALFDPPSARHAVLEVSGRMTSRQIDARTPAAGVEQRAGPKIASNAAIILPSLFD